MLENYRIGIINKTFFITENQRIIKNEKIIWVSFFKVTCHEPVHEVLVGRKHDQNILHEILFNEQNKNRKSSTLRK